LIPFLRSETNLKEINTESPLATCFKDICQQVEPIVLTITNSGSENGDSREQEIVDILESEHGFIKLGVADLLVLEAKRKTRLG